MFPIILFYIEINNRKLKIGGELPFEVALMSYIALYRQHRPQTFAEIKGQEHISRTLKNALAAGRLSHAYLFCGPRGTGKTSTAKVLAKAVNCRYNQEGEPCNQCPNCQRITAGTSMDVLEIDAASNRGIDEIRDLREKINLSPVEGSYKVYIIDEVHMLTTEAFNALLKTLEEPPRHVIFILATTEPRKIPATILSRCQRFDFRQIAVDVILDRLREVAASAGVTVEEEALYLIARQAKGGLRDALGLLDQCLAGGQKNIHLAGVAALLGAVEDDELLKFHRMACTGDIAGCLLLLDEFLNEGRELKQFVADLTLFYRNLLLIQLGGRAEQIVAAAPEIRKELKKAAGQISGSQLQAILRMLNQTDNDIKWSSQARILVELGIIDLVEIITGMPQDRKVQVSHEETGDTVLTGLENQAKEQMKPQLASRRMPEAGPVNAADGSSAQKPKTPRRTGSLTSGTTEEVDLASIQNRWERFLEVLRKKTHASYEAFLKEGTVAQLAGNTVVCEFQPDHKFHKERLEEPQIKKAVEQVLREFYGHPLQLQCRLQNETGPADTGESEMIKKAIEIFGGELVDIIDE